MTGTEPRVDSPRSQARGLIVSCQPVRDGPLDDPAIVAAFVRAAEIGGAQGIRIEGLEDLRAARNVTALPITALIKGTFSRTTPFITTELSHVQQLVAAGADVIAFDGTRRSRRTSVAELVAEIHRAGRLAMADCADFEDGVESVQAGADYVATTLSGYTSTTELRTTPDFALIRRLALTGARVVAEGNIRTPEQAGRAYAEGAFAVTVGSAITRPELITEWFDEAIAAAAADKPGR